MTMKRLSVSFLTFLVSCFSFVVYGQMQTVAESSDFRSTSNYSDVMKFIGQLQKSSKLIRVESIATSSEGRDVPLLIIGKPLPKNPEQLIDDKHIVVYIQANIHAGEVEGKEASLMFARDILSEKDPDLLKHAVLLICPNFNPDGNEQIDPANRTNQNGPVNGVGLRHNGQLLDLNRDAMKAESPEVRGVISNVFNKWDPAVFMDCHTTNGSYHVEPVTFTWMVNPNGDNSLIKYMSSKMVPQMSSILLNKYKVENCYYGEFNNMMKPEEGWFYDACDPRYMTNYYGLRNRLSILNENYVHADYRSRVMGCYYLIKSLADYVSANSSEIKKMLEEIDNKTVSRGLNPAVTDSFAIEFGVRPLPEKVTIRTYEVEPANEPGIYPPFRKTDRQTDVKVPYYIDFYPKKSVKFPFAYLVKRDDRAVTDLLKLQGIKIEKLISENSLDAERFEITSLEASSRLNQGHYTNRVTGRYISETVKFPEGTILIRTAQPLASLAAYLLEPQSGDGLLTWNFWDRYLVPQWGPGFYPFPVYRIIDPVELNAVPLD